MKRLLFALFAFIFVFSVCLTATILINDYSVEIEKKANICYEDLNLRNDASVSAEELFAYWKSKRGVFSLFVYHDSIENAEKYITLMNAYAKENSSENFNEAYYNLMLSIDNIQNNCKISLESLS